MNFASKKMVENNPVPILTPRKAPLLEKIDALCENEKRSLTLLVINVSGKRFETYQSTLERFPNTLLGNAEKRQRYFNKEKGEYYFDRNRSAFNGILYYYQSGGSLETPRNVSETVFTKEVMFFELGDDALGLDEDDDNIEEEELPTNKALRKIWLTFEHPSTSKFAKVLAIFSVTVILLSIVVFCLETIPDLDPHKVPEKHKKTIETTWFVLNTFCNVWFTIEFVLRLIASPNKCKFVKTTLNIIDLISILPYYVGLFLGEGKGIDVLRVIRVIRVVRIFKLTRHSRGLHILGNTIRASFQELVMLVLFLIIGVILFSSAVYYAESSDKKNAENFSSIPHSFWWAVVTMTTVGYGDISPVTLIGKLVGAMCAISGVLVIALPVPVIVSNFELFYKEEKDRQAREEERKRKIKGEGRGSVWSATFGPGSPISETGSIISRKIRKLSNAIIVKLSPSHAPNGGTVADGPKSDDLNQEELDEICAIDDIKVETEVMLENKSKGTSQEETTI